MAKKVRFSDNIPVIPLRNTIVVPSTITPLLVGRPASVMAAERALLKDKRIICVTQKNNAESDEDPKARELYRYGTLCAILQVLKLPDGTMRHVLVAGHRIGPAKRLPDRHAHAERGLRRGICPRNIEVFLVDLAQEP